MGEVDRSWQETANGTAPGSSKTKFFSGEYASARIDLYKKQNSNWAGEESQPGPKHVEQCRWDLQPDPPVDPDLGWTVRGSSFGPNV